MKITIEFDTDNAEFEDNRLMAVTRIMKSVKEKVLDCVFDGVGPIRTPIKDINGNRVGVLEIKL